MPGPGAKGIGDVAIRNFQKWQEIRINMDTICEKKPADTTVTLFGKEFSYPFFAGPVGAVKLHYGEKYTDQEYNEILLAGCMEGGIAAFTGLQSHDNFSARFAAHTVDYRQITVQQLFVEDVTRRRQFQEVNHRVVLFQNSCKNSNFPAKTAQLRV